MKTIIAILVLGFTVGQVHAEESALDDPYVVGAVRDGLARSSQPTQLPYNPQPWEYQTYSLGSPVYSQGSRNCGYATCE
jgi:hypothetical protein